MKKYGIELKTGTVSEGGGDKRSVYKGCIDKRIDSTFLDDVWIRTTYDGKRKKLFFALYLREGEFLDVVQEYERFRDKSEEGKSDMKVVDFLNNLRNRYLEMMPDTAVGSYVFSLVERDGRLYKLQSREVSSRERLG